MENIGEALTKQREKMNITLEHAAHDLQIRVRYLEALESGNFTEITHRVYLIGYLRTYANYLSLDGNSVISYFKQNQEHHVTPIRINEPFIEDFKPSPLIVLLSILVIIGIYLTWVKFKDEPLDPTQVNLSNPVASHYQLSNLLANDIQFITNHKQPNYAILGRYATNVTILDEHNFVVKKILLTPGQIYFLPKKLGIHLSVEPGKPIIIFDDLGLTLKMQ